MVLVRRSPLCRRRVLETARVSGEANPSCSALGRFDRDQGAAIAADTCKTRTVHVRGRLVVRPFAAVSNAFHAWYAANRDRHSTVSLRATASLPCQWHVPHLVLACVSAAFSGTVGTSVVLSTPDALRALTATISPNLDRRDRASGRARVSSFSSRSTPWDIVSWMWDGRCNETCIQVSTIGCVGSTSGQGHSANDVSWWRLG